MITIPTLQAKWAFSTRRVARADAVALDRDVAAARPGDLVLARIERIGSHKRLQLASGAHSDLWEGDLVVAACGDRYAADQFEGRGEIAPEGCDLLAGGGLLGWIESRHARVSPPTRLVPLGRPIDREGVALSLDRYARPRPAPRRPAAVIGVVGSGMNAGKTTAAAALIRGLVAAGVRTAGLKATGTGAFGDLQAYEAAGAAYAADFAEDGLASTYRIPAPRIVDALDALLGHAAAEGCEAAVVEIADGLLQPETAAFLAGPGAARVGGWIYAAGDALSALGGLEVLARTGIRPMALSGLLTRSPLAMREAEAASGAWVMSRDELADPAPAAALLSEVRALREGTPSERAA
ncbi:MAG TPA: hypothetical protein VJ994_10595 [Paracoccaceae bacterium]|nr:hypothetical protein [Paracoccaceae bacterium]